MRPPHYTGEDMPHSAASFLAAAASMRPPHYTGEDMAVEDMGLKIVLLQ